MNKKLGKFVLAGIIYTTFALYLYQPYFKTFNHFGFLLIINSATASLGCYVLSKRWVASFIASFFAGAIYGFGPFVLSLAKFHPTAGLLAAAIPWMFCPAALGFKFKWPQLRIPLAILPFLMILLFFQAAQYCRLFAIPLQTRLTPADLAALLAPLVMVNRTNALISFYHVPIAPLIMGFYILLTSRRYNIIAIFCLGLALSFCPPFLSISPVIWFTIPALCSSILIGAGIQALIYSGRADRKWMLAVLIIMLTLAIVALLLATKYFQTFMGLGATCANLFVQTAKMYLAASAATAIIFIIAHGKFRLHWMRIILLALAMTIDIFLAAQFITDKIL